MDETVRARGVWIARNVLPHEASIRSWLKRSNLYNLECDDVVQEMYARIVSLDSFDNIRNPKQYAFQVAHSVVADHMRRARVVSIFSVGNVEDLGLAAPEADPEQKATFSDEINHLVRVLAQLPERTRDILVLRRLGGLSQRQTADRLAISEKTVEKHMARGVLMLMTEFGRGGKSALHSSKQAVEARPSSTDNENATQRN